MDRQFSFWPCNLILKPFGMSCKQPQLIWPPAGGHLSPSKRLCCPLVAHSDVLDHKKESMQHFNASFLISAQQNNRVKNKIIAWRVQGKNNTFTKKYKHCIKRLLNLCFSLVYLFTLVIHGSVKGKEPENDTRHKMRQVEVENVIVIVTFLWYSLANTCKKWKSSELSW